MVLSRRNFVRLGSMCLFSAGLSLGLVDQAFGQKRSSALATPGSGFPIPIQAEHDPLFFMSKQTFTQYRDTKFVIDPGYTFPIETKLVEVKDTRSAAALKTNAPGKECFLLTFQILGKKTIKQGTYQVRHDALGTFELFVVPSEDRNGNKFFEAVINREVG